MGEWKRDGEETYLETVGAITLQGPHQVAKQSRTTILLSLRAVLKSGPLNCMLASLHPQLPSAIAITPILQPAYLQRREILTC